MANIQPRQSWSLPFPKSRTSLKVSTSSLGTARRIFCFAAACSQHGESYVNTFRSRSSFSPHSSSSRPALLFVVRRLLAQPLSYFIVSALRTNLPVGGICAAIIVFFFHTPAHAKPTKATLLEKFFHLDPLGIFWWWRASCASSSPSSRAASHCRGTRPRALVCWLDLCSYPPPSSPGRTSRVLVRGVLRKKRVAMNPPRTEERRR